MHAKAHKARGPGSLTAESGSQILQICTHSAISLGTWLLGVPGTKLRLVLPDGWLCKFLEGLYLSDCCLSSSCPEYCSLSMSVELMPEGPGGMLSWMGTVHLHPPFSFHMAEMSPPDEGEPHFQVPYATTPSIYLLSEKSTAVSIFYCWLCMLVTPEIRACGKLMICIDFSSFSNIMFQKSPH